MAAKLHNDKSWLPINTYIHYHHSSAGLFSRKLHLSVHFISQPITNHYCYDAWTSWHLQSLATLLFVYNLLRLSKRHQVLHYWPFVREINQRPGPWFDMKMSSYQYRKSHYGDKTILRPSYLHNGISYTGKMTSLYWIGTLWFNSQRVSNGKSVSMLLHHHDFWKSILSTAASPLCYEQECKK